MTLALRATNDGGGVILLNGSPKITLDAAGNIVGTLTPGRSDSSQKLANTEFVKQMMGNYRGHVQIQAATTLSEVQAGFSVQLTGASSQISLPLSSSVPSGTAYHITNTWSSPNGVFKQGSDQLFLGGSAVGSLSLGFSETATVVSNGIDVWYVVAGTEILKAANMFSSLKAQNGWQKLPSGLVLQWGTKEGTVGVAAAPVDVTFPVAFPTACLSFTTSVGVFTAEYDSVPTYRVCRQAVSSGVPTRVGVNQQIFLDNNTNDGRRMSWVAIGY